jgi:rod shape-determining protein MreB
MIGERTAEQIKIQIGTAYPIETIETDEVRGRDLVTGCQKPFKSPRLKYTKPFPNL